MERYRNAADEDIDKHLAPSSTGSNYSPANPRDAPGMSVSNFIEVVLSILPCDEDHPVASKNLLEHG